MSIQLGTLIRQLEACKPDATVRFDFCGLFPHTLNSSRGDYSELALGWAKDEWREGEPQPPTVADLLTTLREAIGKTYSGYKGGDYVMRATTEVWVDQWGEWTATGIKRVIDEESFVYIETARRG